MNQYLDLALHSYSRRLRFVHEPNYDVFEFINEAAHLGFTGVNISLSGPDNHALPPYRHLGGDTPAHRAEVVAALRRRGLSVELDTDTVEAVRLRDAINIARDLGASILRTFTHHRGADALRATIDDLRAVAPAAEDSDVVIAVENHEEFTAPELATLVEKVSSSHVRLLFDYGNALPVLERPSDALRTMLPHVVACHVKDVAMIAASHSPDGVPASMGVPLGQGHVPLHELTQTLVENGLRRFALQNVWGYHVPLGRLRPVDLNDPRLGVDDFRYLVPDPDLATVCFYPAGRLSRVELIAHETSALRTATHTFHQLARDTQSLTKNDPRGRQP